MQDLGRKEAIPGCAECSASDWPDPDYGFHAIRHLAEVLSGGENHPEAEAALLFLALLHETLAATCTLAAGCPAPPPLEREVESPLPQRMRAVELLIQTHVKSRTWPGLRNLMKDKDVWIAVLACKICLMCGSELEKREAIFCLISSLPRADPELESVIERCLIAHFKSGEELINAALRVLQSVDGCTRPVLLHVKALSQWTEATMDGNFRRLTP
jgi:hypothetical protein